MRIFPHATPRPVQQDFMVVVASALKEGAHALIHAPTGIGKTAAALAPAVEYAIANKKTVFFLTSRHTQHMMAITTLRAMRKQESFVVIDLIAKQKMCLQPRIEMLLSGEFSQFCREVREKRKCDYYIAVKKKDGVLTPEAEITAKLLQQDIYDTHALMQLARDHGMCPYEIAAAAAKEATVIIADYSYIFNEQIQAPFFARLEKDLDDAIVIVDEAHNLPARIKDLASVQLSTTSLRRAITEADKENLQDELSYLQDMLY